MLEGLPVSKEKVSNVITIISLHLPDKVVCIEALTKACIEVQPSKSCVQIICRALKTSFITRVSPAPVIAEWRQWYAAAHLMLSMSQGLLIAQHPAFVGLDEQLVMLKARGYCHRLTVVHRK
jgi:hypothetical protein